MSAAAGARGSHVHAPAADGDGADLTCPSGHVPRISRSLRARPAAAEAETGGAASALKAGEFKPESPRAEAAKPVAKRRPLFVVEAAKLFASHGYVVIAPFHGDLRYADIDLDSFADFLYALLKYRTFVAMQAARPLSLSLALDAVLGHPDFRDHVDVCEVGPFRITTARVNHPVPAYAVRVEAGGRTRVSFVSGGSEANETAIKLARLYGHQQGVADPATIVMERAFHGRTMATLSATGNRKAQAGFEPLVSGFVRVPYNDLEAIRAIARYNNRPG